MTPIVQLYWIRVVLGIVAGAISAVIAAYFAASCITDINYFR